MSRIVIGLLIIFSVTSSKGQIPGTKISLNGVWDFEQTTNAFPPETFTRKCPVPGLIHLAEPKIDAFDNLFQTPEKSFYEETSDYRAIKYQPMYSWYRRIVDIPDLKEGTEIMLTILKSQYVTQVYINGNDAGQSVACYTPIRLRITGWLKPGQPNEILIRVGERIWLPPWAAGSTDKEKANYIPGIWDDVFLSFSGKQKILKSLILPSAKENTVTAKLNLRSFYPQQVMYGDPMLDSVKIAVVIKEKTSGSVLSEASVSGSTVRDNESQLELKIPVRDYRLWSPESPFLYEAEIRLYDGKVLSDNISEVFGMRDFERKGKYFYLNGEKYILRGTNITLHRFLEDPDCRALPWDREWVKKMLIDDPKKIGWNAMRICVGLVPDFWYDLADEYGIMFQNEWMYWQNHGWDQQIREEYTDWVWSDGNHPSIVIWDAINENWNSFIGNVLIPELQQLDPTRIWDAGYMTASEMKTEDPVDEPHPYRAGWGFNNSKDPAEYIRKNPYRLGKIEDWEDGHRRFLTASAAQLVNEYGWNWLWRDGQPAKLTKKAYDYLIGADATPTQRREFQAYWLQCETEWLRAERSFAGVLAFTHLTNNYGFTGDWYINNIKDLETGPSFVWFRHAFASANVFIDLADQRYFPNGNYEPKQKIEFKLVGVNDNPEPVSGRIELSLFGTGNKIFKTIRTEITIPPYGRKDQPVSLQLPSKSGGYLVETKFRPSGSNLVLKSRRYIKIGNSGQMIFPETEP
jgi:beta-galactosidase/beta-glucuronidase